ncbi:MAG: pentapeptide repeat-containing protein, partial [Pirellulales bacterium]|nr:pentapeptide repeat-containing protein [Pirellulales bacterium]
MMQQFFRRSGGVAIRTEVLRAGLNAGKSSVVKRHCASRSAALAVALVWATVARADIYQWEYVNPGDPMEGKQPSATLCPGGSGVDATPYANLSNRDLTMAYFIGKDLQSAYFLSSNLTDADLSQANLTNAVFESATLTIADFTGAQVQGARFKGTTAQGFTAAQLYSTASYQAHDLTGI